MEILAPFSSGGVDRVWGSSTTWMLELRDGRRMSITLSLLRIPASLEENKALASICPAGDTGLGSESKDQSPCNRLQVWSENDVDDDYVLAVWEDPIPSVWEGDLLCWGEADKPLEVAPLAMAISGTVKMEMFENRMTQGLGSNSPASPWVLETLIVFGIVLGTSFEGYEEELMGILKGIEERRNQQGKDKKKVNKLGGKGSRELKNLINHINYDNGSAKSSGNLRERGMVCSPCS